MFKKNTEKTALENAIEEQHQVLADSFTDEYETQLNRLERLYALKTLEAPKSASADTKLLVAGNLAGIAMIVGHERANVVTSKALNFLGKLR